MIWQTLRWEYSFPCELAKLVEIAYASQVRVAAFGDTVFGRLRSPHREKELDHAYRDSNFVIRAARWSSWYADSGYKVLMDAHRHYSHDGLD